VILVQSLFVEAMADLVQDSEEGVAEIVVVEASRDAAVTRPDTSPKIFCRSRG
jgi:hypothetical protein